MENKLQENEKEILARDKQEFDRYKSILIDDTLDGESSYLDKAMEKDIAELFEKEECHVCGNVHPYTGSCRGGMDDVSQLPSKLDSITEEEAIAFNEKESEKEAMKRFFNGEEPTFTTGICEFLQAGYGECSDLGYWEYPLPAPAEQWLKPKSRKHDLKIKIGGLKYKARIVPFDSDEIIKRNYVCAKVRSWDSEVTSPEDMTVARILTIVKNAEYINAFIATRAVGDSIKEHRGRMYLEIVDETYPGGGEVAFDFLNSK